MSVAVSSWNRCFLCSTNLVLDKSQKVNKNSRRSWKILLKYLLDDPQLNSLLAKDVVNVLESSTVTDFCGDCVNTANLVGDWDQEGNVGKIEDQLRIMRNDVIRNSRVFGENVNVDKDYDAFEEKLEEREEQGVNCGLERKLLDVLTDFQTFLYEKEEDYVLSFGLEPSSNSLHDGTLGKLNEPFESPKIIETTPPIMEPHKEIKKEPNDECELHDHEHISDFMDMDEGVDIMEEQIKIEIVEEKLPAKTRSPKMPLPSLIKPRTRKKLVSPKVKYENRSKAVVQLRSRLFKELALINRPRSVTRRVHKYDRGKVAGRERRVFKCHQCNHKVSSSSTQIEYHLKGHETSDIIYFCPDCEIGFSGKQALLLHLNYHFIEESCDVCDESIAFLDMESHLKTYHGNVFSCPGCSYCFGSFKNLAFHVSNHFELKLKCELCPSTETKEFSAGSQLQSHLLECHEYEEVRKMCSTCDVEFSNGRKLENHVRTHHPNQLTKNFCCDVGSCDITFLTERLLLKHKIEKHKYPRYKCALCKAVPKFKSKVDYKRHMLECHGRGRTTVNIKCRQCSKEYPTMGQLRLHEQVHSKIKRYCCTLCKFATRWKTTLYDHFKRKHADKEMKKHECSYCNRKCISKGQLVHHLRTHALERPFQCETCGRSFRQKQILVRHEKQHVGGKIFLPRGPYGKSRNAIQQQDKGEEED